MVQRQTHIGQGGPEVRRDSPWRWGLLLTLRDRLDRGDYRVSSDAVATSIIDRTVARRRGRSDS